MHVFLSDEDKALVALEYIMYKTGPEVCEALKGSFKLFPNDVYRLVKSFGFQTRDVAVSPRHRNNLHINSFNMELLKTKGW